MTVLPVVRASCRDSGLRNRISVVFLILTLVVLSCVTAPRVQADPPLSEQGDWAPGGPGDVEVDLPAGPFDSQGRRVPHLQDETDQSTARERQQWGLVGKDKG